MYLSQYTPRSVTLCVSTEDQEQLGWLQRMSLYEKYPLEVTIVPAARTADVDRQARVAALVSQVKLRCSTVGVELVDELVAAVTHDIAQRYEEIIEERVADKVSQLKPALLRDARDQLEADRERLMLDVKTQQRDEVKGLLGGIRDVQRMFANMTTVVNDSSRKIDTLHRALQGEVLSLQQEDWDSDDDNC